MVPHLSSHSTPPLHPHVDLSTPVAGPLRPDNPPHLTVYAPQSSTSPFPTRATESIELVHPRSDPAATASGGADRRSRGRRQAPQAFCRGRRRLAEGGGVCRNTHASGARRRAPVGGGDGMARGEGRREGAGGVGSEEARCVPSKDPAGSFSSASTGWRYGVRIGPDTAYSQG